MTLENKLDSLKKRLNREEFLQNRGLGNEIPFYIFDYPPEKELTVRDFITTELVKHFKDSDKVKLCVIDLFEMMIERLKKENLDSEMFNIEKKRGSEKVYVSLKKALNSDVVIEEIKSRAGDNNIVIIIGVGKVFPIIEPNILLENLQNVFDFTKLIMFLPGNYNKREIVTLDVFKKNYYRAMRLSGEI